MSNAKRYSREDLLNKAVELFRRKGFNGTSTAELVDALGVNRKSMYSEFGTKQEMFEAVLSHYNEKHLTRVLSPLESDTASLDSIRKSFKNYAAASESAFNGLGCLLCNTASERGSLEPGTLPHIDAYFERITKAFENTLNKAKALGELKPSVSIQDMANYLTTAFIGFTASVRAEAPAEQLWASYRIVSDQVDQLAKN